MTHLKADHDTSSTSGRDLASIGAFASGAALAALFLSFFVLSALYPKIVDIWAYIDRPFDIVSAIETQYRRYFRTNPRIGELIFILTANSDFGRAAANTAGLVLLFTSAIYIVLGRLPDLLNWRDTTALLIVISLTAALNSQAGGIFFYQAFNANYVLGFGLMLLFIAVLRYGLAQQRPGIPFALIVLALGLVAGMTNEHTPPPVIGLMVAALIAVTVVRRTSLRAWHFTATLGLVVGFCLLFFAPARAGSGAFSFSPSRMISATSRITQELLHHPLLCWAIAVLSITCLVIAARTKQRQDVILAATSFLFLALTIGTALPLTVSPTIVPRTMFASHVCLAISGAASAMLLVRKFPTLLPVASFASVLYLAWFTAGGAFVIGEYAKQYAARETVARIQIASGCEDIVIGDYNVPSGSAKHWVVEDNSERVGGWRHRRMARYWGVSSLFVRTDSTGPGQLFSCDSR